MSPKGTKHVYNRKKSKQKNKNTVAPRVLHLSFTHPGGSSAIGGNRISKASFRIFGTQRVASTTAATVVIGAPVNVQIANMGARGVALGDLFSFWRLVDFNINLKFHPGYSSSVPQIGNVTWFFYVVFAPATGFTNPTTVTELIDLPHLKWEHDDPSKGMHCRIGRSELLSSMPYEWLKTTATGVNDEDYIQMCFFISSSTYATSTGAGACEHVIDYTCEFRGTIDPADNPLSRNYSIRKNSCEEKKQYNFE